MGIAQDRIRNFMGTLAGSSNTGLLALDEAVRSVSNFSQAGEWVDSFALELRHYALNGRTSEEFLADVCSVYLGNQDTGAISGSDAGNGIEKTAVSIILEDTAPVYPTGGFSDFRGLRVYWGAAGHTAQERINYGLNSWWISRGLELIEDSYGMGFTGERPSVREMGIEFVDHGRNGTLAYVTYSEDGNGVASNLALHINMSYYWDILGTDYNGVSSAAGVFLDRTIAHELTHAVMAANIRHTGDMPVFLREGLAELVHGIDDVRTYAIRSLVGDETALRNALNIYHTDGASSFDGEYAAGYLALRYLANRGGSVFATGTSTFREEAAAHYDMGYTTLVVGSGISGEAWLDGRTGVTFVPGVNHIDASGANGTMILAGNDQENVIRAGLGRTSIWGGGGASSDVLQGGGGHDDFFYGTGEGYDTILDYREGDVIDVYQGNVHGVAVSGQDFVMYVGDGTLTVQNAANCVMDVAVSDTGGMAHAYMSTGTESVIDGRSLSGFEVIAGNGSANVIYAGDGGSSVWGGAGQVNDVMSGGRGVDTFLYGSGEGVDYIQGGGDAADRVLFYNGAKPASVTVSDGNLVLAFGESDSLVVQGWSASGLNTFLDSNGAVSRAVQKEDGSWVLGTV